MSDCADAAGHRVENCCATCHAHNEGAGEYMHDGFDEHGIDLHVCCNASVASVKATRWDRRR